MGNPKQPVAAIASLGNRVPASDYQTQIQSEIANLHSVANGLVEFNANPSKLITEAAHTLKVQSYADNLKKRCDMAQAKHDSILRDGVGVAAKQMDAKVKLTPDPKYEAEIRRIYVGLGTADQIKYLRDLAVANKGPSLAAIIEAPLELTNCDPALAADMRNLILETHAGDEIKAMRAMSEVTEPLSIAIRVARGLAEDFSDAFKLEQIRQTERLAEAAEKHLNEVLG